MILIQVFNILENAMIILIIVYKKFRNEKIDFYVMK